jgi:flavodoxin
MQNILIVFYSRTGVTKKVARNLADELMADMEEIESIKNRDGISGYAFSGYEATKGKDAKIKNTTKNPADYDLIIIGTPVWAWSMSSPIRSYINKNKFAFKNIAFFATYGGNIGKTFIELEKLCNKPPMATLGLLTKEVIKDEHKGKMAEFVGKLK